MGAPFNANERGSSRSIGETLHGLGLGKGRLQKPVGTRRTGQPVRRNSYYANDRRARPCGRG